MRAVIDSGGYLYMTVQAIKQCDSDDYEEIITCNIAQLWRYIIVAPSMIALTCIYTPQSPLKMWASDYLQTHYS